MTVNATYDEQDRIQTFGTKTYTHNDAGEVTSISDSATSPASVTTYTYDVFGNLKSVALPSTVVISYVHDGQQRRTGRRVGGVMDKQFTWFDQLRPAAELDSTGVLVSQFIYGLKGNVPDFMIRDSINYKIMTDHLGSVVAVVNSATGAVVQAISYDEFGRVLSDTNPGFQPFGFAGGMYDHDTGLVTFGARNYDPETGRWVSKDPILFAGGDTNLYGYVLNDPVNLIDPSGKCPWCIGGAIGAISAGATAYLSGGSARDIAVAAGVGAVAGAATMGVSAFTTSATGIIASNSFIGLVANVATQMGTGTALSQVNIGSALIGAAAGGIGGAAGLGAGNMAFFGTGVIGNPLSMSLARSREFWASTITGATVGTGVEAGANVCR